MILIEASTCWRQHHQALAAANTILQEERTSRAINQSFSSQKMDVLPRLFPTSFEGTSMLVAATLRQFT